MSGKQAAVSEGIGTLRGGGWFKRQTATKEGLLISRVLEGPAFRIG